MTAFLAGCSAKDPDEALCEDMVKAVNATGARSSDELEDSDKKLKAGRNLQIASHNNKGSQYSDALELYGRFTEAEAKADHESSNPEYREEKWVLEVRMNEERTEEKVDEFYKKCLAFRDE